MKPILGWTLACMALVSLVPHAAAQNYPSRALRLIVPYPPGGPTDLTARTYAEKMSRYLGQPVVVDNKPGAQGVPAVMQLLQQPADGYTLYFGSLSTQVVFPIISVQRKQALPYDARKDLAPVSLFVITPVVLTVGSGTPFHSVKELVDKAKAEPGKLNFGSDGVASLTHLGGEMFSQAASIQTVHVPYKGTAEFTQALVAGDVQYAFSGISTAVNMQKQGRSRIVAVASPHRNALLPNTPTVAESGYPGFDLSSWFGVYVRSGTAKPQIDALAQAIQKAGAEPDLAERLSVAGLEAQTNTPEQFGALIDADTKKWTSVIEKAAIKFDN